MKMKKKRLAFVIMSIALLLYVATYAVLSSQGKYTGSQSGKMRFGGGFSFSDISEWRARGCWFQANFIDVKGEKVNRGNKLGFFFAPLIMIDQKWIHKTETLEDPTSAK